MAKVGIVMGSDSDMPIMAKAADVLKELGIDFDMTIISAHREPEEFFAYAKGAEEKGYKNGYVMWPVRTAVSGKQNTPGGATEIMEVLGKAESVERIKNAIELLSR